MVTGKPSPYRTLFRALMVLAILYVFLVAIKSLGGSLKMLGGERMEGLVAMADNPFIGLVIGILVTSIIQSSSTTTSIVVGMVGSGQLTVEHAVPIIMGANIGTTVTNTLVALTSIGRRDEFRLAISAATMHDFFNILVVVVLLPFEIAFHSLTRLAEFVASFLKGAWGFGGEEPSTFQMALKWGSAQLKALSAGLVNLAGPTQHEFWTAILFGILAIVLIFVSLYLLVRVLKSLMLSRVEILLDKYLGGTGVFALFIGFLVTALVQSSSVTTSTIVPVVAAGVIALDHAFPITLGANVGTTVTALLAALAADKPEGLTIAVAHFLFNVIGILIFYPLPQTRRIPLGMAKWMGGIAYRSRTAAIAFVALTFFIIPTLFIFVWRLVENWLG